MRSGSDSSAGSIGAASMERTKPGKKRPSSLEWWNGHPALAKVVLVVGILGSTASIFTLAGMPPPDWSVAGLWPYMRAVAIAAAAAVLLLLTAPLYFTTTKIGMLAGTYHQLVDAWFSLEQGELSPAVKEGSPEHKRTAYLLYFLRWRLYIRVSLEPKDHIGPEAHRKLGQLVILAHRALTRPMRGGPLMAARMLYLRRNLRTPEAPAKVDPPEDHKQPLMDQAQPEVAANESGNKLQQEEPDGAEA